MKQVKINLSIVVSATRSRETAYHCPWSCIRTNALVSNLCY